MGCFSFICTKCGKPINSDSFSGENARLSLLKNGEVIEEMQGQYDSYGRVFDDNGDSVEWNVDWNAVCDLMFDPNPASGIAAVHAECAGPDYKPKLQSKSDPNQGWGEYSYYHSRSKCEHFHKVY